MKVFLETLQQWLATLSTGFFGSLLKAALIVALGVLVIRAISGILTRALAKSKLEKAAHSLILSIARIIMFVLLALITASSIGIDVTGVVALASVATLAISLAIQNMLGNVVGGFTLLYTQPFHSGDFVEVAGQAGTVKEVGIAYTRLITPDNKLVSIPNSAVVSAEIVNYSTTGTRRVDIAVSASYDAPMEQVLAALRTAAQNDKILEEPEGVFAAVTDYGESAINYVLRFWVRTEDYWPVRFAVHQNVKAVFDREGISMTYPHLNVHLDK